MRHLLFRSSWMLSLWIAIPSSAVTMAWSDVGNPGNPCVPLGSDFNGDPMGCYGSVATSYRIGTYEVTNAQYAEFLNAKAASDPFGLFNPQMNGGGGLDPTIVRSGASGSYSYSAAAGQENKPVEYVSFYDSLRFANWMNNGQGSADTETGSYTLLGGTATPSNGASVARNAGATIVLPSVDEWYKAAYYDALSMSFFNSPAASNLQIVCDFPTSAPNRANCGGRVQLATPVGSYSGSASPYGTFDQGGNAWEWSEQIGTFGSGRVLRGGGYFSEREDLGLSAIHRPGDLFTYFTTDPSSDVGGIRLASIPEPGTGLLVAAGLLALALKKRAGTSSCHS